MPKLTARESERIKKEHEQTIGNQFVEWLAQCGGPVFVLIEYSEATPDLVYKSGENILNVEHTSAQYDIAHRRLIDTPVLGGRPEVSVWPPYDFSENTEPKDVRWMNENLASSVVEAVWKKGWKARNHRYKTDPILLVEVLPAMTAAEDLERLLRAKNFPSDWFFVGVYVVGRFPETSIRTGGYSTGGFRVIPIKHSHLTENLPKKEYPVMVVSDEDQEVDFLQAMEK